MSVYGEFFTKFMSPFFDGLVSIFKSFFEGLFKMFNVITYIDIISEYKGELTGVGMVILILSIIFLVAMFAFIFFCITCIYIN